MFSQEKTALLIIDIQEKLTRVMYDKESLIDSVQKLIKGAKILDIPILWTEQYPKGLGPTIPEVAELLTETEPVIKMSFSCCGDVGFRQELANLKRQQILITGVETHVCVYQTAADLLSMGYEVQVIADCVSSRTMSDKIISLEKMKTMGTSITSVEMVLFELLKTSESDKFKDISQIVK